MFGGSFGALIRDKEPAEGWVTEARRYDVGSIDCIGNDKERIVRSMLRPHQQSRTEQSPIAI
jgi:hypothetical protein